ncbi:PHB depolymerase family esterase [Pseudoxanthobacter sp. M-2]|uniref:extracellular catalytic domain type 1 short-chain-length polyhydroxyalkanoate depolymerase n=1 Tax=Pseudoxanthobacter sp. M-2 TaxID=3078754 RepID=UPI0038FCEAAC
MRPLSDTLARLARLRAAGAGVGGAGASEPDHLPPGIAFGANPGALDARLYAPAGLPGGAPLVVVLHGCKQTAAGYDRGTGWTKLADRHGFAVLYAEQRRGNNANLCFNWFQPGDIARDAGEALSIRQMVGHAADHLRTDPRRVYVTGLSAGGAMTAVMLATYPDVFAGGAVIAGLPYGVAATIPEAFDRMRGQGLGSDARLVERVRSATRHGGPWPTLSVWHGSADQTVVPSNGEALLTQWRGLHDLGIAPTQIETVDGQRRRVWRDGEGRAVLEAYTIAGLGHGTPVDAGSPDGIGASGAFILDAGISSTHHIARFWGITEVADGKRSAEKPTQTERAPVLTLEHAAAPSDQAQRPRANIPPPGGHEPEGRQRTPVSGVQKVIEDALRAAGLMK